SLLILQTCSPSSVDRIPVRIPAHSCKEVQFRRRVKFRPSMAKLRLMISIYHPFATQFRLESLFLLRSEEHTSELQSQSNLVCRLPRSLLFPYTTLFRSSLLILQTCSPSSVDRIPVRIPAHSCKEVQFRRRVKFRPSMAKLRLMISIYHPFATQFRLESLFLL